MLVLKTLRWTVDRVLRSVRTPVRECVCGSCWLDTRPELSSPLSSADSSLRITMHG